MITYLACPYSDPDPRTSLARFEAANHLAAYLMSEGELIYSPISHSHPIAMAGDLPTGWSFWEQYDRAMIAACSRMIVYCLPGWAISEGVGAEIEIARELGLPVEFYGPNSGV